MDQAFSFLAKRRRPGARPARLDHGILTAAVAAQQAASAAALERVRSRPPVPSGEGESPLVELILAGPDWREAWAAQQGCFSRSAARPCKDS